jgi:RNase adaptor protein for sRNA GlmZ degradation
MKRVLITGMSGTGKSTAVAAMGEMGYRAVDTDTDEWSEWIRPAPGEWDWVWREDRISELLAAASDQDLFVAGCKSNQGKFRSRFEHVVLLSAPTAVILDRLENRTTNNYGKSTADLDRIIRDIGTVEPLLRSVCDLEINTSRFSPRAVADRLHRLVND